MTDIEAIEILKDNLKHNTINSSAINQALVALNKQVPMKVKDNNTVPLDIWMFAKCGRCSNQIDSSMVYCSKCGQKIDLRSFYDE